MIEFLEANWPLVHCTWTGEASVHELRQWFDRLDTYLDRGEPFALVVDLRKAGIPTARDRVFMAERIRQQADRSEHHMIQALVFSSAIQRGIITALNWAVKQPYPQKVFASTQLAETWALAQVQQRGRRTA